jgi:hypothetical protein
VAVLLPGVRRMTKPVAFMSYARRDNEDDRLTELRDKLIAAVSLEVGEDVEIFMDQGNIQWGQDWKARLEESIDDVWFFIPIVTPSFFNSKHCQQELRRFLDREEELGSNDLIFPIYYRDTPLLNQEARREANELARKIHAHQRADWRQLRNKSFDSDEVESALEKLGRDFRDAWERVQERLQRSAGEHVETTFWRGTRSSSRSLRGSHLSVVNVDLRQQTDPHEAAQQIETSNMETINWLTDQLTSAGEATEDMAKRGLYAQAYSVHKGVIALTLSLLDSLRSTGYQQISRRQEA